VAPFPTIPDYIDLEMKVMEILTHQEFYGWAFDEQAAQELESELRCELEDLTNSMKAKVPYVPGVLFTPKRPNRIKGYVAGAEFQRLVDFNPGSREHIAYALEKQGWKATEFTETGKPTIDETVLKELGSEDALAFFRILELTKQLGMLTQGANAWLKLVKNGRIHHHCSVSTNTHRCAHRRPNIAQIPSEEPMQRLWIPSEGMVMVGADLNAIELRMLAHYLSRYDGGRYGDILINDDIHQVNADKIGVTRRQVKTITYAFLYGAGDAKIGTSFDPQLHEAEAKKVGKEIRAAFVAAIDGLAELLADIKKAAAKGYIRAIDQRKIKVDSPHKALNYLLQSSAGIVAKRWMVVVDDSLKTLNVTDRVHQLAFIHDCLLYDCSPDLSADVKLILEIGAKLAGEYYKMGCEVAAEGKVGSCFWECH
jgi:DNA polymerase I-like protein with 3'-5' exonuclease and polymerase domains